MPTFRTALLAGAAMLSASAALAGGPEPRTIAVDLPDGSVAQVRYFGEVPPNVTVAMPPMRAPYDDRFIGMEDDPDAIADMIEDDYADAARFGPGYEPVWSQHGPLVVVGERPAGFHYFYTLISTSPSGQPCTRTIEWFSNGFGREPDVLRSGTGECGEPGFGPGAGPHHDRGPGPGAWHHPHHEDGPHHHGPHDAGEPVRTPDGYQY